MDEYLTALQACSPATNVVPVVSHGAIRINEMGFARTAHRGAAVENAA